MNPTLKAAYQTVRFQSILWRQNPPTTFVIVTAFNPKGRNAPLSRNQHADRTLEGYLKHNHLPYTRITGMSPDQRHQEPGWGIEVSEKEGIKIGVRFQQEAIYVITDQNVILVSCHDPQERSDLGSWTDLQITE